MSGSLVGGINPAFIDPFQPQMHAVPNLPGHTPPLPVKLQDTPVYYTCTLPNHHMHRQDGKRLAFHKLGTLGVLKTNDVYDVQYISKEIANGIPFIRPSTQAEIDAYNMHFDAKGTIEASLRPKIEEQVRSDLMKKLQALGVAITPEQEATLSSVGSVDQNATDEQKITGVKTADNKSALDLLKSRGISAQGATIVMNESTPGSMLSGIAGTDKMANAADSNQAPPAR